MNLEGETVLTGAECAFSQPPLTAAELAPHFLQLDILECLGRGGMGVVYKARQKSLNRLVALKLLAPERVADEKFAERFAHEARALAKLNHPNIVTIHDFGQAGGFYFLIMEFVDGVNLRQAMKARRFTPEQALAVVPPVCEALQYAHEHGVVHRDIKPENLLLDKAGRVKIADFGIAKLVGHRAEDSGAPPAPNEGWHGQSSAVGTPGYSAPEQRGAPSTADHRADIYSLGVVLYEMLTGELPAANLQPPSRRVQVDVRLDEIVLRALEVKPEFRFPTAHEFRTQIEAVTSRRPAPPSVPNPSPSPSPNPDPPAAPAPEPRLSRLALVGACWAPFLILGFVGMFVVRPVATTLADQGPTWWQWALRLTVLPPAATAPFGTTILGWLAFSRIRRAPDKLYGLELAFFDGVLFPLLALDGLLAWVGWLPFRALIEVCADEALSQSAAANPGTVHVNLLTRLANDAAHDGATKALAVVVLVGAILLVDAFVARALWRALHGARAEASRRLAPGLLLGAVGVAAMVCLLFSPSMGAGSPNWGGIHPVSQSARSGGYETAVRQPTNAPAVGSQTRAFPLRHVLASDMAPRLRQILLDNPGLSAKPSANNQEVIVTAPPEVMNRVETLISATDWPEVVERGPDYEYPRRSVMETARSFFYACAIEDAEEVFSKMLSPSILAELKGDTKSEQYLRYNLGGVPDPEWEKSLRGAWPGKKERLERFVREWNRYPLKLIREQGGVAIGFGVKHFCSVSFEGAPADFYDVTIEPGRGDAGPGREVYFFRSLPPWWKD